MRILAVSNTFVPATNAGAQWTLHGLLKSLSGRGDRVEVVTTRLGDFEPYTYEGMPVRSAQSPEEVLEEVASADVVVAHLDGVRAAADACRRANVPLVHLVHTNDPKTRSLLRYPADVVAFASAWLRCVLGPRSRCRRELVVPPLVDPKEYATEAGAHITLVNLSRLKGADMFYTLAERFPQHRFLGVVGGHEEQLLEPAPNIEIVPNRPNMRERVYARTRLLLMPSRQESFGRVGLEAAASGIPTVAAPVEGLCETLSDAALFVPADDPDQWAETVATVLECPGVYARYAARSRARARQIYEGAQHAIAGLRRTLSRL